MIKTVQEGLARYKRAIRAYAAWARRQRVLYERTHNGEQWNRFTCSLEERAKHKELRDGVAGMRRLLGLSKSENRKIYIECGLQPPE